MKQVTDPRANATRQKNLLMLVLLSLVGVGFYFLTLVRMGEQPPHDQHPAPSATPSTR
ncbi:MAG: hypothetical protein ACT4O6_24255 [Reyranella sp.]